MDQFINLPGLRLEFVGSIVGKFMFNNYYRHYQFFHISVRDKAGTHNMHFCAWDHKKFCMKNAKSRYNRI